MVEHVKGLLEALELPYRIFACAVATWALRLR